MKVKKVEPWTLADELDRLVFEHVADEVRPFNISQLELVETFVKPAKTLKRVGARLLILGKTKNE